jgi:mono/diheme cytochrome c family protein
MRYAVHLVVLAVLIFAAGPVRAQAQSVERGREFAQRVCAECHAIRSGSTSSAAAAPSFPAIAAIPGMTAIALRVALLSSHRDMPNLALTRDELDDVIAYILSLQPRN